MDLVTIATFPDLPEAELAKERLEKEGIRSFVLHKASAGILPGVVGGVQVQVVDLDAPRAREVLAA